LTTDPEFPASTSDATEPHGGRVACSAPLCGLTMNDFRSP